MSYYKVFKDTEFVQEHTDSNEVVQYILAHPSADILVTWRKRDWMPHHSRAWDAQEFLGIFGSSHLSIDSQ